MSEISAADIPGQYRLKTLKPVQAMSAGQVIGTIPAGRYTPIVDSYTEQGGNVFWEFWNDIPGVTSSGWRLKHEKGAFLLVPYVSNPEGDDTTGLFDFLPTMSQVSRILPFAAIIAGLLLFLKFRK
jgi:hypothetical protein